MRIIALPLMGLLACAEEKAPASSSMTTVDGTAIFEIEVGPEQTAFMVTAEASSLLATDSITDPSGEKVFYWEDWYTADSYLTAAVWPLASDMVLNWPIRPEDAALEAGTWKVEIAALNEKGLYQDGVKVTTHLQTKKDSDFTDGQIKVVIAFAEGVEEDAAVVGAIEAAVARWEEVWAEIGLNLQVRYATAEIESVLPYIGEGSTEVAELSEQTDSDEILMIIGERIDAEDVYYGVSGNIPGSLITTPRSAVTISWLANSGLDGEFSTEDIRLMGETMAHETSHYMGLFHPVETSFEAWDAVRDTEKCTNAIICEEMLGGNLMFPYPVCSALSCQPQFELTDIQTGIAHRYTGVQ